MLEKGGTQAVFFTDCGWDVHYKLKCIHYAVVSSEAALSCNNLWGLCSQWQRSSCVKLNTEKLRFSKGPIFCLILFTIEYIEIWGVCINTFSTFKANWQNGFRNFDILYINCESGDVLFHTFFKKQLPLFPAAEHSEQSILWWGLKDRSSYKTLKATCCNWQYCFCGGCTQNSSHLLAILYLTEPHLSALMYSLIVE